uniref:Uncharacterized protein n=1 Tax=Phlebotomus papatasi TaxID=29031 RepID=A0A1B0D951_PHLPP
MDFEELKEGQKMLIELEKRQFCGEFKDYDCRNRTIQLVNLKDFKTMKHYSRSATFLIDEILGIRTIEDTPKVTKDTEDIKKTSKEQKGIVLTMDQIKEVQEMVCTFQYIIQPDKHYFEAVRELKGCQEIGLDVIGGRNGRFGTGSLLVLSSRKRIYIFDIMNFGSIPGEIKEIFEAQWPQKIIHDSISVADFLMKHNIKLNNISDTWIAHTAVAKSTVPLTVGKCVQEYLKIPMTDLTDKDNLAFSKRPLDIKQCSLAAEQVAFLHHLNTVLLHGNLFKRFYEACQ